jgi:mono/diheme cytochrome c family protein
VPRALAAVALVFAATVAPVSAQPRGDARRGAALYEEKCALCHGGQGEGWDWSKKVARPPVPVPDLGSVVRERDDGYLFSVVKEGGEAVGRSRFMPPFGFQLTDDEVWHLVAYMRTLPSR